MLRAEVDRALDGVTALVAPSTPLPAVRHGTRTVPLGGVTESVGLAAWRLTHPFNLTGHPVLQVPVGLTDHGLPVGIQIVGGWLDETTILQVGAAYEAHVGVLRPGRPPAPRRDRIVRHWPADVGTT